MKIERGAAQSEAREKATWTIPVLKKGAVESETAMFLREGAPDGLFTS